MDDPIWISEQLAISIHQRQLSEHGGIAGVRDMGLLSSALARPRQLFAYSEPTADIPSMAAAYAFGIARNHPFLDGNKRTAAVVCETFIILNGLALIADDQEMYETFLNLAAGQLTEDALAEWLRGRIQKTA